MVRVTDFDTRRDEILRSTIELYLETAQPISSDALIERYRFGWSPATIRNVLKDLEERGLLTHPHTSAGRIPTDYGYRHYINGLMQTELLNKKEQNFIDSVFESYLELEPEATPEDTASKIIADITHYVGLSNSRGDRRIRYRGLNHLFGQPEFRDVETMRSIVKILEEDRLIELMEKEINDNFEVFIGEEFHCPEILYCSLVVSECDECKEKKRIAVLGPKRMAYRKVIPVVNYLCELVSEEF